MLLVTDEEWRTAPFGHVARFAGFDACLCFEAGERTPDGEDAVVVKRKAAGTMRVSAAGLAAHSGSAPHKGRNALLALASVAGSVAALADPGGPDQLTVVPTVMRSGDAFNVVPADGELIFDIRARAADAFERVMAAVPADVDGVAARRTWSAAGRAWMHGRPSRRCSRRRARGSGGRSAAPPAAAPATPATSRRRSRSRSTGSDHAVAAPTPRPSSCSPSPCGSAPRSRSRSPRSVLAGIG